MDDSQHGDMRAIRAFTSLLAALLVPLAASAQTPASDLRCQPPMRLEVEVLWNSLRGLMLDLHREPVSPLNFNEGCALVTSPQFSGSEVQRWTVYGRIGIFGYRNEFGSQDGSGGFSRNAGPKVGTITFGIRRQF